MLESRWASCGGKGKGEKGEKGGGERKESEKRE